MTMTLKTGEVRRAGIGTGTGNNDAEGGEKEEEEEVEEENGRGHRHARPQLTTLEDIKKRLQNMDFGSPRSFPHHRASATTLLEQQNHGPHPYHHQQQTRTEHAVTLRGNADDESSDRGGRSEDGDEDTEASHSLDDDIAYYKELLSSLQSSQRSRAHTSSTHDDGVWASNAQSKTHADADADAAVAEANADRRQPSATPSLHASHHSPATSQRQHHSLRSHSMRDDEHGASYSNSSSHRTAHASSAHTTPTQSRRSASEQVHSKLLEEEIKSLQLDLADANTDLEESMRARAFAEEGLVALMKLQEESAQALAELISECNYYKELYETAQHQLTQAEEEWRVASQQTTLQLSGQQRSLHKEEDLLPQPKTATTQQAGLLEPPQDTANDILDKVFAPHHGPFSSTARSVDSPQKNAQSLVHAKAELEKQVAQLEAEVAQQLKAAEAANHARDMWHRKFDVATADADAMEKALKRCNEQLIDCKDQLANAMAEVRDKRRQESDEMRSLQKENEHLKKQLFELNANLKKAESENKHLLRKLNMPMSTAAPFSTSFDTALQQNSSDRGSRTSPDINSGIANDPSQASGSRLQHLSHIPVSRTGRPGLSSTHHAPTALRKASDDGYPTRSQQQQQQLREAALAAQQQHHQARLQYRQHPGPAMDTSGSDGRNRADFPADGGVERMASTDASFNGGNTYRMNDFKRHLAEQQQQQQQQQQQGRDRSYQQKRREENATTQARQREQALQDQKYETDASLMHANEECDFNIFTGEPKASPQHRGPQRAQRRNVLHPETRMSWIGAAPSRSPSANPTISAYSSQGFVSNVLMPRTSASANRGPRARDNSNERTLSATLPSQLPQRQQQRQQMRMVEDALRHATTTRENSQLHRQHDTRQFGSTL